MNQLADSHSDLRLRVIAIENAEGKLVPPGSEANDGEGE